MKAIREAEWAGAAGAPQVKVSPHATFGQALPSADLQPGAGRRCFAGHPGGRRARARRAARLAGTRSSPWSPGRTPRPAAAGKLVALAGGACGRRGTASRCSSPDQAARPGVPRPSCAALAPDCCPVVAYGALLPRAALDIPTHGWVNLHFSLLPAWRGAAPVQHALIARRRGHRRHHLPARGGPGHRAGLRRDDRDDPARRHQRRPARPARRSPAPSCWWPRWTGSRTAAGAAVPQPADGVCAAPKITVGDARVDWRCPRSRVDRQIRACTPAPGAWTDVARRAAQARPGALPWTPGRDRPDAEPARPAGGRAGTACSSAPAPRRCGSARSRPPGKRPMAARRLGPRRPAGDGERLE